MDAITWLEQLRKIDQLIDAKRAERHRLEELAVDISAKPLDGMPHSYTGTVSRKVENAVINIIMLEQEIDKLINEYIDYKREILVALEKLPATEYGVLHRRYIRYMTWEKIAEDMDYSVQHVRRIKKKALENLEHVMLCSYPEWYNI